MGRPPRAAAPSTRIVGFRLTEEEKRQLDELVKELGHKDRSALLRAWLVQAGPGPQRAEPLEQDEHGTHFIGIAPKPEVFR
jgi:Ribbon-helix-helix protein, copG family